MFDAIIIAIIVVSSILGIKKGFVRSIGSIISLIITFIVVYCFHNQFAQALGESAVGEKITEIFFANYDGLFAQQAASALISVVALVVMYLLVSLSVKFTIGLIDCIAKLPVFNALNKILGIVSGVCIGIFWVALIVNVLSIFPETVTYVESSKFVNYFDWILFYK